MAGVGARYALACDDCPCIHGIDEPRRKRKGHGWMERGTFAWMTAGDEGASGRVAYIEPQSRPTLSSHLPLTLAADLDPAGGLGASRTRKVPPRTNAPRRFMRNRTVEAGLEQVMITGLQDIERYEGQ
ncbi:hypothetical protein GGTG_07055 [Gaeumannomyces tritici R3-111a-1]|uniref:Uncharacterized protein n=1 Tax=Gaeumannomyces tritici (strain R3-111a-1) TaxID=644352 RepID=J3P0L0_GAET3|nr:hypothetical protein GGTG_07055 [Gaeumannomyces tritici R3-111a-1]EJT77143.1 hypothetical protein GGTG_07055 [Gaeumannomyces tritici R3-111a-1]